MLRIALDHDKLEAQLGDVGLALAAMRGRGLVYDPDLLAAFESVIGSDLPKREVREVRLGGLRAGMILAADVRSDAGALLIARGHTATDQLIARLSNLRIGSIREPLVIVDDKDD